MAEEMSEFDTPWRRSLDEIEPALSAWALARFAEPVAVANVASPGNGMSSETVLFDVHNVADGGVDHYVARLAPLPDLYPVFPDYDLELQRKCMDLVRANTDVPAPEVAFFERDTEWLRTPFLVMRRVDGSAPPDIPPYVFEGWILDATPEQRRRLQDDLQLRGPGAIYGTMQHGALDLRVANLTDIKLIASARNTAQEFIDKKEELKKYPYLAARVSELRAITNLN